MPGRELVAEPYGDLYGAMRNVILLDQREIPRIVGLAGDLAFESFAAMEDFFKSYGELFWEFLEFLSGDARRLAVAYADWSREDAEMDPPWPGASVQFRVLRCAEMKRESSSYWWGSRGPVREARSRAASLLRMQGVKFPRRRLFSDRDSELGVDFFFEREMNFFRAQREFLQCAFWGAMALSYGVSRFEEALKGVVRRDSKRAFQVLRDSCAEFRGFSVPKLRSVFLKMREQVRGGESVFLDLSPSSGGNAHLGDLPSGLRAGRLHWGTPAPPVPEDFVHPGRGNIDFGDYRAADRPILVYPGWKPGMPLPEVWDHGVCRSVLWADRRIFEFCLKPPMWPVHGGFRCLPGLGDRMEHDIAAHAVEFFAERFPVFFAASEKWKDWERRVRLAHRKKRVEREAQYTKEAAGAKLDLQAMVPRMEKGLLAWEAHVQAFAEGEAPGAFSWDAPGGGE